MTIIMSFFGLIVFFISLFVSGFKAAFKRLMGFIFAGALIDLIIVGIAFTVIHVSL